MAMTAEQAKFLLEELYLGLLKRENSMTRTVLEAIPADRSGYKPDECAKTAMELARHIATAENRFLETVVHGVFDVTSAGIPETVATPAELVQWYQQKFTENLEALSKLSGEALVKIVDFRGIMKLPAVAFLQLLLLHSAHHRGQLSTYLRPMGSKVPAIYGESYDSAAAKKAAQA